MPPLVLVFTWALGCLVSPSGFLCSGLVEGACMRNTASGLPVVWGRVLREGTSKTGKPPNRSLLPKSGLKVGKECAQGNGAVITVIWRSPQFRVLVLLPHAVHFLGGCEVLLTKGSLSDVFTTWSRTWVVVRGVMGYTVSAALHPGSPWPTLPPPGSCALLLCSAFLTCLLGPCSTLHSQELQSLLWDS